MGIAMVYRSFLYSELFLLQIVFSDLGCPEKVQCSLHDGGSLLASIDAFERNTKDEGLIVFSGVDDASSIISGSVNERRVGFTRWKDAAGSRNSVCLFVGLGREGQMDIGTKNVSGGNARQASAISIFQYFFGKGRRKDMTQIGAADHQFPTLHRVVPYVL